MYILINPWARGGVKGKAMFNDLVAESLACSKLHREFRTPRVKEVARSTDLQLRGGAVDIDVKVSADNYHPRKYSRDPSSH